MAIFSKRAIFAHRQKAHNYRNPLHLKVVGSICMCCYKQQHTRTRMMHHLAIVSRCAAFYSEQVPDADPEVLAKAMALTAAHTTKLRRRGLCPQHAEMPVKKVDPALALNQAPVA